MFQSIEMAGRQVLPTTKNVDQPLSVSRRDMHFPALLSVGQNAISCGGRPCFIIKTVAEHNLNRNPKGNPIFIEGIAVIIEIAENQRNAGVALQLDETRGSVR